MLNKKYEYIATNLEGEEDKMNCDRVDGYQVLIKLEEAYGYETMLEIAKHMIDTDIVGIINMYVSEVGELCYAGTLLKQIKDLKSMKNVSEEELFKKNEMNRIEYVFISLGRKLISLGKNPMHMLDIFMEYSGGCCSMPSKTLIENYLNFPKMCTYKYIYNLSNDEIGKKYNRCAKKVGDLLNNPPSEGSRKRMFEIIDMIDHVIEVSKEMSLNMNISKISGYSKTILVQDLDQKNDKKFLLRPERIIEIMKEIKFRAKFMEEEGKTQKEINKMIIKEKRKLLAEYEADEEEIERKMSRREKQYGKKAVEKRNQTMMINREKKKKAEMEKNKITEGDIGKEVKLDIKEE